MYSLIKPFCQILEKSNFFNPGHQTFSPNVRVVGLKLTLMPARCLLGHYICLCKQSMVVTPPNTVIKNFPPVALSNTIL